MNSIWKDIEGYEGFYQVSSTGQVRSLDRVIDHHSSGKRTMKGMILKPRNKGNGYVAVVLCKNGKCKNFSIHRLVAEAFVVNPENKPDVNHLSGIKTENGIWNLDFATRSENMRHAFEMGLCIGKVLTDDQVDRIRSEYVPGSKHANQYTLAEKYGVSQSTIKDVVNYKGRYAKQGI